MSEYFNRVCKFLRDKSYSMDSAEEDFLMSHDENNKRIFSFRCNNGHRSKMTYNSFTRKKNECDKYEDKIFCSKCASSMVKGKRSFTNLSDVLVHNGHVVVSSLREFVDSAAVETKRKIRFKCARGHVRSLSTASIRNIKLKKDGVRVIQCSDCKKEDDRQAHQDEFNSVVENQTGHVILSHSSTGRSLTYKCGNCGEIRTSHDSNMKRNTGVCGKCQNDRQKNKFEDVENELWCAYGIRLVEYMGNKNVTAICTCNNEYITTLHDIRRGRLCIMCKTERAEQTCLVRYGVPNPAQSEEFKQKARDTFMTNYGVDHPSKNPEIKEKTRQTNLTKYGVEFAFTQEYVYMKIKETHLATYGVEYPLQSATIQQKLDRIFNDKYGARRPFMSQELRDKVKQIVKEKYGAEYFLHSDAGKEYMKQKYGSEYFVITDEFKRLMVERYGAEHPMHCPALFHKAMKKAFSKKKIVLPQTGRVLRVMGYEDIAISYILSHQSDFHICPFVDEDDISIDENVPQFQYTDDDGGHHVYYPDIFIKRSNLVCEVKSIYTFNLMARLNYLKFCSVVNGGYTLKVIIYGSRKRLRDIWTVSLNDGVPFFVSLVCQLKKNDSFAFDKEIDESWGSDVDLSPEIVCDDEEDDLLSEAMVDSLEY